MGKVRRNNEDNFVFDGKYLDLDNKGMKETFYRDSTVKCGISFAVFDGMGGENFGEYASYRASAEFAKEETSRANDEKKLNALVAKINDAVVDEKKKMLTERMGTTMVSLHFAKNCAYVCNVGDSRAYRLRDRELTQLSEDHVEKTGSKKAPLTQHLGIDPEEMLIEPYIVKEDLQMGDVFLLCSDGVTDMLTDAEITAILRKCWAPDSCVEALIAESLAKGGKDNITAVVVRLY